MFKVIVAGSRNFNDYTFLRQKLDQFLLNCSIVDTIIISGGARGADNLAEIYAKEKGYEFKEYIADWGKYSKQAGYIRNKQMVQDAQAAVIFWDGQSKGSSHMIELAKEYNLKLKIVFV